MAAECRLLTLYIDTPENPRAAVLHKRAALLSPTMRKHEQSRLSLSQEMNSKHPFCQPHYPLISIQ